MHGNSLVHGPQKFHQLSHPIRTRKRMQFKKHQAVLPHLQNLDVSHIEQLDSFFEGLIFYVCSNDNFQAKETLHIQIKRSGGRVAPNFLQSVTHIIACEAKGFHCQVAVDNNRDIICHTWISDCIEAKMLLPFSPRHYLFQSPSTRENCQMVIDTYGDPWYEDSTAQDLLQVLKSINSKDLHCAERRFKFRSKGTEACKNQRWDIFEDFHFYFHKPLHSVNPDSQKLAIMTLRRLQLGAEMFGAITSCNFLSNTTHVIIFAPSMSSIPTKKILQSFKSSEKVLLQSPCVNIVGHSWLEECMRKRESLCINPYLLSKSYGKSVSNQGEAPVKESVNSISHEGCGVRNSNYLRMENEKCPDVAGLDLYTDDEKVRPCSAVGTAYQAVKTKQRSLVAEGDSSLDSQLKRPCKRYKASPRCSLWDKSLKQGKSRSVECVETKEGIAVEETCKDQNLGMAQEDTLTMAGKLADKTTLQCDSKVATSNVLWESEHLQDIAQVYLGSFSEESTLVATTGGLSSSAPVSQASPKEFPSSTCIPKRRFTCRGWL